MQNVKINNIIKWIECHNYDAPTKNDANVMQDWHNSEKYDRNMLQQQKNMMQNVKINNIIKWIECHNYDAPTKNDANVMQDWHNSEKYDRNMLQQWKNMMQKVTMGRKLDVRIINPTQIW